MSFEPFAMERWQSLHEHHVAINLSDSGVHPLTARELLADPEELAALADVRLGYTQTDGTPELRRRIAALYPGADETCVLVTSGGAEANFLAAWTLLGPGDELALMLPNYMQLPGVARALGAAVRGWSLVPDFAAGRWRIDPGELEDALGERTRLVAICNPNNPTGARLGAADLDALCRAAERRGTWLLADEIYRGSELDARETPSVWGRSERAIVTSSLSKVHGLPGLRLGWIVAPPELIEELWTRHDYTTIAPAALSDRLARAALAPERHARLVARAREHLARNLEVAERWLTGAGTVRCIRPEAGGMLYLKYAQRIGSTELAERLRAEHDVLVVPGDHFGMDGWLRVGFGGETQELERGLVRLGEALDELA